MNIDGQIRDLLVFERPALGSYLIVEALAKDDSPIGVYILSFANTNVIKMGRAHECDIRVNDISVSRFHA